MVSTHPLARSLRPFGASIFAEMTALALATDSVNLGQGFPDYQGPREVLDAAVVAINAGHNQYPPGIGVPDLRLAIAEHQKRFQDIELDPDSEVLVTMGATEAIAAALLGTLDPGDEVVVFEPLFDTYAGCIALAHATLVGVPLRPDSSGTYRFDVDEFRRAITPRTRMILLNSPHNPTGKVFTNDELRTVADAAREHDLIVVSDEVYEHLVFEDSTHVSIATMPGMRDRTVTISSGGKTFNTTGWKVGWACGPHHLVRAVRMAKQLFTFAGGTPFQSAIATGLRLPDAYFSALAEDLQAKRDVLVDALSSTGLVPHRPESTYFVTVDIRPLQSDGDGTAFCNSLPERCGVVAIPGEALYSPAHAHEGRHLVRFAFCKNHGTLAEAVHRISRLP